MNSKICLKGEIPSVIDGQFSVSWSFDYFWCLLPWAHFSPKESKALCSSLFSMGIREIYACKKENYISKEKGTISISTACHEDFLLATINLTPDEYLIFDADYSIIFYCNYSADLLAIRFSRGKDIQGILSSFLDMNSEGV